MQRRWQLLETIAAVFLALSVYGHWNPTRGAGLPARLWTLPQLQTFGAQCDRGAAVVGDPNAHAACACVSDRLARTAEHSTVLLAIAQNTADGWIEQLRRVCAATGNAHPADLD